MHSLDFSIKLSLEHFTLNYLYEVMSQESRVLVKVWWNLSPRIMKLILNLILYRDLDKPMLQHGNSVLCNALLC